MEPMPGPGITHGGIARRAPMDTNTLLIILIVLLLLGGGGWYGRGRWY
jgi:LPXTG-motif cell wall-anchored protein